MQVNICLEKQQWYHCFCIKVIFESKEKKEWETQKYKTTFNKVKNTEKYKEIDVWLLKEWDLPI